MPFCRSDSHWPYPRWIAHRGAGQLAPENTLAAFCRGASYGYRMMECDVKLSLDGVPFLLHDDTLNRTTDAAERWGMYAEHPAGDLPWQQLAVLDAGKWHSEAYQSEPLPTLERIIQWSLAEGCCLNLEIKPSPGVAEKTGHTVAHHVAHWWRDDRCSITPPLLSSFQTDALWGALRAEPHLPRALLLDQLTSGWLQTALELECVAVVLHHSLIATDTVQQIRQAGLRLLSYTVNSEAVAAALLALDIDGIITDRVDYFAPDTL
jgi:glycerophosphoryl diester phosphodiesterase